MSTWYHGLTCLKRQIDVYLLVESLHSHFATCKFFINENFYKMNIKQNGTLFHLQLYWGSTISGFQRNKVEKKIHNKVIILFYLVTKFLQIIFLKWLILYDLQLVMSHSYMYVDAANWLVLIVHWTLDWVICIWTLASHCIVFLGKTLNFHGTFLHPGASTGTRKYNGGSPVMDYYPILGGVQILVSWHFMLHKQATHEHTTCT